MPLKLGSFVSFDPTKIDKLALRKWLVSGATLLEPAVITPGNFDKLFFDNLDSLIEKLIDQVSNEGGTLIVGASKMSAKKYAEQQVSALHQQLQAAKAQIDKTLAQSARGDMLIAGEVEVSQGELSTYLAQFSNAPQESQAILRDNPRLVRRLKKFSKEDQQMIVGNPFLLLALQTLLPILFQFLLNRFKD